MNDKPVSQITLRQQITSKFSRLNVPVMASLELTYRCNLRCAHCYVDVTCRDELSFEDWKDVISQLKAAGTIYLLFTGGEITMRGDFLDIARYARQRGFVLCFITNSTNVTPSIAEDIARLRPFSVATSLYGANAATHDAITMTPGSFERTLRGVRYWINAGISPSVLVTVMRSNYTEVSQIRGLVRDLGARLALNSLLTPSKTGDDYPSHCTPSPDELIACGYPFGSAELNQETALQLCKAGKGMCSISPKGDVNPCLSFPLLLGNVRVSNFDSIWRLEPCAELRYLRSMRLSDLYACDKCKLSAYCQRCTGSAYLESGRMDGPSPTACRQAEMRWRLSQAAEV